MAYAPGYVARMNDSISRLFEAVSAARDRDPGVSRTGRLLVIGPRKFAKKIVEESAEVTLKVVAGNRNEVIRESADLIYHLVVLWVEAGVQPKDIWAEMERRKKLIGIAEKLPKARFNEPKCNPHPIGLDRTRLCAR